MNATGLSRIEDHALVRTFCGCFSDMDHLQEELRGEMSAPGKPAINIAELTAGYIMELALPGYKSCDLQVLLEDDVLVIKGGVSCVPEQYEAVHHFYKKEFCIEPFCRSFLLPEDVESASARLEGGILFIELMKGALRRPAVDGSCDRVLVPIK
ncbi:Hsp20/alpha crystallin family protein [Paraflavitalea sp. CAU 1676]|uniref:Hsp20/alpha crystallin family protein n=1 Tax=Paraflavitalea sp. CAU 1676 TaxID=3032598 RepID=UPI0023DC0974|nr:Hsp20/alpha crystallin family protein [Paraflavitalea sp. CAU 1676]MDF2190299.1 Hsp20/alpha crystallin family protein [Paraflavitalea sp. CAU 1676]